MQGALYKALWMSFVVEKNFENYCSLSKESDKDGIIGDKKHASFL